MSDTTAILLRLAEGFRLRADAEAREANLEGIGERDFWQHLYTAEAFEDAATIVQKTLNEVIHDQCEQLEELRKELEQCRKRRESESD